MLGCWSLEPGSGRERHFVACRRRFVVASPDERRGCDSTSGRGQSSTRRSPTYWVYWDERDTAFAAIELNPPYVLDRTSRPPYPRCPRASGRSEEHTSELQ